MVSGGKYGDAEKFKVSSAPSVAPSFQGVPVIPTVIEKKGAKKAAVSSSSGLPSAGDEFLAEDPSAAADSEAPSTETVFAHEEGQEA